MKKLSLVDILSENEQIVSDYFDTLLEYNQKDPADEFVMQLMTGFPVTPQTSPEDLQKYVATLVKKFGSQILEFPNNPQFWKNVVLKHAANWSLPAIMRLVKVISGTLT